MSSEVLNKAAADAPEAPAGSVPTIPSQYQQLADQLKTAIANVLAAMPPMKTESAEKPASVLLGVPRDFVVTLTRAVRSDDVAEITPSVFDPADADNVVQFVDAFRPLVDDAAALSIKLNAAVKSQYGRIVEDGLNAYAILRRLGRKGKPSLQIHLQNLRRDLGRLPGRRVKAKQSPNPVTQSA